MKIVAKILLICILNVSLIALIAAASFFQIMSIKDDIVHVSQYETLEMLHLKTMQNTMLHGSQEALSYIFLNESREKADFEKQMRDFDRSVEAFMAMPSIQNEAEIQQRLNEILVGKKSFTDIGHRMFSEFEITGSVPRATIATFIEQTEATVPMLDQFVEFEQQEIEESIEKASAKIDFTQKVILALLVTFASIMLLIGFFMAQGISRNITTVKNFMGRILEGKEDATIKISSKDEVEDLATQFNIMTRKLSEARRTEQDSASRLEKKTYELKLKVEELEKFNRIAVGRELKMMELKKRIKELEQRTM